VVPEKKPVVLNPSLVAETSAKSEAADAKAPTTPVAEKKRPHVRHKRKHKRKKSDEE
jgi:hypothetical protein